MYTAYDYANQFLDRNNVDTLPVDVKKIAKESGYIIRSYRNSLKFFLEFGLTEFAKQFDSFTYVWNQKYYIFVADSADEFSEQQLIAHELGHIEMHIRGNPDQVVVGYARRRGRTGQVGAGGGRICDLRPCADGSHVCHGNQYD